jgi:hypothetical protein
MKLIPLTQGKFAKVSNKVFDDLNKFKWQYYSSDRRNGVGYAVRSESGNLITMHSQIISIPPGFICDHIDRDGLNNTDENLRVCTVSQNAMNKAGNKNTKSGYKGVKFYEKRKSKYRACINVGEHEIGLGYYMTAEEAALAYDSAAKKHFGEFARTNF